MYAQLYHPHDPLFDPNLIVIWLIAVFTVVVGSYWCGLILQRRYIFFITEKKVYSFVIVNGLFVVLIKNL